MGRIRVAGEGRREMVTGVPGKGSRGSGNRDGREGKVRNWYQLCQGKGGEQPAPGVSV